MVKYNKITQKTYDTISKDWDLKRKYSWKPVEDFLEDIKDKENKLLLDLGCGTGRHLELSQKIGFEKNNLIGCDFSIGQLEIVKKKGFKTKQTELLNLPFKDNYFDVIICVAVYHHLLEYDDQLKSLKEMKRVLKKNGEILLSNWFPNKEYIKKNIKKKKFEFLNEKKQKVKVTFTSENKIYNRYYYLFYEKELLKLCKLANLKIKKKEYDNSNLYLTIS